MIYCKKILNRIQKYELGAKSLILKSILIINLGTISLVVLSCSNKTSDEDIVNYLRTELNTPRVKMGNSFGLTGAFQVLRTKLWHINYKSNSTYTEAEIKSLEFYLKLESLGLIKTVVVQEKTIDNDYWKTINVELTDKGKNLQVGPEQPMGTYLKAFDFDGFSIKGIQENSDTLLVEFTIDTISGKTPLYDLIWDDYKARINAGLKKSIKLNLLKTKNGIEIIEFKNDKR